MKLCICQLIKDEQDYIEEWIEYHHNLGFNKFYLIEDFCSTSHKEILKKYDYVELYQLLDIINEYERNLLYNGYFRQRVVYQVFNRLWRHQNNWLAFIDPDEYIDINKEQLYKILYKLSNEPSIKLNCIYMSANGHIYHPNNYKKYNINETYTLSNNTTINNHFCNKQILNCNKKYDTLLSNKNFIYFPHEINNKITGNNEYKIQLKHFMCKSFEEYIDRLINKGEQRNASWIRKIDDWFICNPEFETIKDKLYDEFNIHDNFKAKTNDFKINNNENI